MSWWVCNDIATLGWGTLSSSTIVQVECHFFWYESVQINIMESISPSTSIGATAHVSRRAWGTRANTYTSHCTTKTWGEREKGLQSDSTDSSVPTCATQDHTQPNSAEILKTSYSLYHSSPENTFSAFSPCNNPGITRSALYDIKSELIHQVVTAHSGKH